MIFSMENGMMHMIIYLFFVLKFLNFNIEFISEFNHSKNNFICLENGMIHMIIFICSLFKIREFQHRIY